MSKEVHTDIAVIGSGAAGLMVTKKLAELGYQVNLFEKNPVLAAGPSTKNEGWLHPGSVHAGVITDRERAVSVVKKVLYGYEQILRIAPEAVEDLSSKTFALFKDGDLAEETEERWRELDVWFKSVALHSFFAENNEINPGLVSGAYLVRDKSLNFRLLYQKLVSMAEANGARFFLNTEVVPSPDGTVVLLTPDGERRILKAKKYIYATGLAARKIFASLGSSIVARFWKSHSIIIPKLTTNGFFFVDPLEASIMPHGKFSIACQSEDDFEVEVPDFEVVTEKANEVFQALVRMVPSAINYAGKYFSSACVKPDIVRGHESPRSVDIELHEPIPNHFVTFPGKVTESPYMADVIVKTIFEESPDPRIAERPGDIMFSRYEEK